MKHVVIIGNGISGVTAARHIRKKSTYNITIISSESDYFFSRTALMYIYMGHMKYEHTKPYEDNFWINNHINLIRGYVEAIETSEKTLYFSNGNSIPYDILIIASGSKSNKIEVPGQNATGVQGLVNLEDLELMEANTAQINQAVVVGGGLIGIEMVEMLLSRNISVTMLIREPEFWTNVLPLKEAAMISDHIKEHGVSLKKETQLKEIFTDEQNRVTGVLTSKGENIPCQFVGITVGVSPNTGFLKNSKIETDMGVLVNEFFETNIQDVYAIGDCAQFRQPSEGRKSIEQIWYTGRMHGETLAHTICGNKTAYKPGVWFNAAKFLDIEYQVYGHVNPQLKPSEAQLFWQHESRRKAIRIIYDKENKNVIGFNLLGIRYRHAVCDEWIKNKAPITDVLANLKEANFDPEFFDQYEEEIISAYYHQNPTEKRDKRRKKVFGLF